MAVKNYFYKGVVILFQFKTNCNTILLENVKVQKGSCLLLLAEN